ncbi:MAG: DUF2071 domain-containing protein [Planctomycetales bacterium]|nr:DUF2071 domain-containing protein [Planctomycetales bacterium]
MQIPTLAGVIERRILANYRVDPSCMTAVLPPPFRPQLVDGFAIGGICLIRLKRIRPKRIPILWGFASENAAHRIAVEWDANGQTQHGVFVPRRDTNSKLNALVGGRIFPGIHHRATFNVAENGNRYSVAMHSLDGEVLVRVDGSVASGLPDSSIFKTLESASEFFRLGSFGYSATPKQGTFDALELDCKNWQVEPLHVDAIQSSYFENERLFPPNSIEFDCALLMRNIDHEWHGRESLCCPA